MLIQLFLTFVFMVILPACAFFMILTENRFFTRDFWTHPTIAEMQAEMLRNIPAIHAHRKLARRIDKVNRRVLGDAHDLIAGMYGYESELDRITRLWAPTARQVCEAFAERGPFGHGENAFEKAAREHNHREEATRYFATRRTQ